MREDFQIKSEDCLQLLIDTFLHLIYAVCRGAQDSGRLSTKPPKTSESLEFWKTLQKYLETLPGMLERLRPIAEKVAKDNTIIVMTCNHGQSELLINFVCAAKSRNLDVSSVLLFATDMETKVLAEGLGLSTFYDEEIFGGMPKKAARAVSKELPFLHAISYLSIQVCLSAHIPFRSRSSVRRPQLSGNDDGQGILCSAYEYVRL